jgi:hypothetical protein
MLVQAVDGEGVAAPAADRPAGEAATRTLRRTTFDVGAREQVRLTLYYVLPPRALGARLYLYDQLNARFDIVEDR